MKLARFLPFCLTIVLCCSTLCGGVREDLPLDPGTTWVYACSETTDADGNGVEETRRWTETIRIVRIEETASGTKRVIRETSTDPPTDPPAWQADWLVAGVRVYEVEHGRDIDADAISATDAVFVFPMTLGSTWSTPQRERDELEAERKFDRGEGPAPNTGMYCWVVADRTGVKTPAGEFKDCFELWYRSLPDHTIVWFKKGVGIVKRESHHHGSRIDQEAALVRFEKPH